MDSDASGTSEDGSADAQALAEAAGSLMDLARIKNQLFTMITLFVIIGGVLVCGGIATGSAVAGCTGIVVWAILAAADHIKDALVENMKHAPRAETTESMKEQPAND